MNQEQQDEFVENVYQWVHTKMSPRSTQIVLELCYFMRKQFASVPAPDLYTEAQVREAIMRCDFIRPEEVADRIIPHLKSSRP